MFLMFAIIFLSSSTYLSHKYCVPEMFLSCVQVECLASQALAPQSLVVANQTQSSPTL